MSIHTHFRLGFACVLVVFLTPVVMGINPLGSFQFAAGWIALMFVVRFAYRMWITIPCTTGICSGRMVQRGSKPVFYRCKSCATVQETDLYEGRRLRNGWRPK